MFCRMCGTELEEKWVVCPKCGIKLKKKENHIQIVKKETKVKENVARTSATRDSSGENMEGTSVIRENLIEKQILETVEIGKEKALNDGRFIIDGRTALRILAIIALVCFFCPLYMVSCAGEEVARISGVNLVFGMEYMGEKIDGNLAYGFWALILIIGVVITFLNQKKLELEGEYETVKLLFCRTAVCEGIAIILIWYYTFVLQNNAEGTMLNIGFCWPLRIMKTACVMSVLIGWYQACSLGLKEKEQVVDTTDRVSEAINYGGKILFESIAGVLIIVTVCYYLKLDFPILEERRMQGYTIEHFDDEIVGEMEQLEMISAFENGFDLRRDRNVL